MKKAIKFVSLCVYECTSMGLCKATAYGVCGSKSWHVVTREDDKGSQITGEILGLCVSLN